ncbi:competence damage-inducible protein A [Spirochaetia bacterium]|nr:competence damage-inducible protein A [Spirochaetia bacterium]
MSDVSDLAEQVIRRAAEKKLLIAAAESCTAGLVADLLAGVPGASKVFWGSFVSYTPEAKVRMLGVDAGSLCQYGAVSRETAVSMAKGALERSGADIAVSVTGLAGPEGDGSAVPVGTVYIGVAWSNGAKAVAYHFFGSRNEVRRLAAGEALGELFRQLELDIPSANKTAGTVRLKA